MFMNFYFLARSSSLSDRQFNIFLKGPASHPEGELAKATFIRPMVCAVLDLTAEPAMKRR